MGIVVATLVTERSSSTQIGRAWRARPRVGLPLNQEKSAHREERRARSLLVSNGSIPLGSTNRRTGAQRRFSAGLTLFHDIERFGLGRQNFVGDD